MISLDELEKLAGTNGLTTAQVADFRSRYGANAMTPPVREPLWKQYLEKFDDPIIRILLFAVAVSTIVSIIRGGGILDTIGIVIAILLATGIAFFNEYRSSKEFDVLNAHRDDVAVKVIRDGHPASVPSRDIVVGDLILLEAGDALPADGWVVAADDMFSDESAFTGETEPVRKDLLDRVLKGAFITAGKGHMIAAAVGIAIEAANVIILAVNVQEGVVPLDREAAARLRASGKPVLVAVNKVDTSRAEPGAIEFAELGFDKIFPVSAIHGEGIGPLMDAATALLPAAETPLTTSAVGDEEGAEKAAGHSDLANTPLKLAVVGRPNVGKSSIINALTKSERVIVSPIPGTTRDAVDVPFEVETDGVRQSYLLIDTAGMRKTRRVDDSIEFFSVKRAEDSIARCDIVIMVLDARDGVAEQDKKDVLDAARRFAGLGFRLLATRGTRAFLESHGIAAQPILKLHEGRPNIVDAIKNGEIQLVVNTPVGKQSAHDDSYIRKAAIRHKVPYVTTTAAALAAAMGIAARRGGTDGVRSLQEYHAAIG